MSVARKVVKYSAAGAVTAAYAASGYLLITEQEAEGTKPRKAAIFGLGVLLAVTWVAVLA